MKNNDLTIISKACGLESRTIMDYCGAVIRIKDEDIFSILASNLEDEFQILSTLRNLNQTEKNYRTDMPEIKQDIDAIIKCINCF